MGFVSDLSTLTDDELHAQLDDLDARIQAEQRAERLDRVMVASLTTTADAIRAELHARAERGQPSGWQGVTDDALAAWALDKIAAHQAEIERIRRNAQAYIELIQSDALADEKPHADSVAWLEGEVRRYYESLPDAPATYKLPNGKIERRKGRESTKVDDPDAFVSWADKHAPDAVKRTPLVSALKGWPQTDDGELVTPDGEVVPGVRVVVGEPTVTIKPTRRPS